MDQINKTDKNDIIISYVHKKSVYEWVVFISIVIFL